MISDSEGNNNGYGYHVYSSERCGVYKFFLIRGRRLFLNSTNHLIIVVVQACQEHRGANTKVFSCFQAVEMLTLSGFVSGTQSYTSYTLSFIISIFTELYN